jgi:hypothetical protein
MVKTEKYSINVDLDRDRIKSILLETYNVCGETLETEFNITAEDFASKVNSYLDSNRVSTPVSIFLPSKNYPELRIDVNLRQKKIIARLGNRKKQVLLNRYLTKL